MIVEKKENVKMAKKQYIGLDIGTNSVGWAVTNENYEVVKAKGKLLYGSRIFPEASDAKARRSFRANRRRMNRRKERMALLESIFAEPISKVDFDFFQRMKESAFYGGDKTVKGNFSLFNDDNFTDKDYYQEYPTIYHLRKAMIEKDQKFDIRLLYLAVHHLIKYRGNFLLEGQKLNGQGQSDNEFIINLFNDIKQYYAENEINIDISLNETNIDDLIGIFIKEKGINSTKLAWIKKFGVNDTISKSIFNALAGGKVKIDNFYPMLEIEGIDPDSLQFSKSNFEDEILPQLVSQLGDDALVIEKLFGIYSWLIYKKILNRAPYYSFAMVDRFETYKQDLRDLKNLYRKYLTRDEYNRMFKVGDKNNYSAYNKGTQYKGKKKYVKGCKYDDFIKDLKKEFEKNIAKLTIETIDADGNKTKEKVPEYQHILDRIESKDFLKKIVVSDNGVLPYQLNELELDKILSNQAKYYDFLNSVDDGWTISDKIKKLLTFRVPYYVGPLNDYHKKAEGNGFSWLVRRHEGKITPWNFNSMVDLDKSEDNFILNMTNKCTYLPTEDVLPKQSLLYQEYLVLNELNNIKFENKRLDVECKKRIFNELFCKRKRVTIKAVANWLKQNNYCDENINASEMITGLDKDFKSSLSSYISFAKILGPFDMNDAPMVEEIIKWMVISPDRKRLQKRIRANYLKEMISDEQIDGILHISLSGWGKFSRKLLNSDEISYENPIDKVNLSIIDLLYQTNKNFMEILFDKGYGLDKKINEYNDELMDKNKKITYEDIDALPISPLVKRPVNQSLKIVREIRKITKKDPDKIFVEVTREHQDKKHKSVTESRKETLSKLYESLKKDCADYDRLINELKGKEVSNLRQDKLYLYFTQLGKDMYTGKPIDIEELSGQKYDIDHIYPQSIIKDDSLSNRVLVNKQDNARKTNVYPIDEATRQRMRGFWHLLHEKKLISDEKYNRLIRSSRISAEEISSFVSRQIVTTSQSTKAVINLLQLMYPQAKIIWSKAKHVTKFRNDNKMLKSRDANDYHHAKDAYLNIVVGNVFYTKYTLLMATKNFNEMNSEYYQNHSLNYDNIYERNVPGAWSIEKDNKTLDTIKKYMDYNCVLFTVMPTQNKGQLFDQNIVPKSESSALIPLKESGALANTSKYGGYNKAAIAYFFLVESLDKKGKKQLTIESMPVMFAKRYEKDSDFATALLEKHFNLKNPKILVKKILINSLIKINNTPCRITGKGGKQLLIAHNIQWNIDQDMTNYLHLLEKYRDREKKKNTFDEKHPLDSTLDFLEINHIDFSKSKVKVSPQYIKKSRNLELYDRVSNQLEKDIYNGVSFDSPRKVIKQGRDKFISLDIKSQVIVLLEMIHLLRCNSSISNLSLINGLSRSGLIQKNKKINAKNSFEVIDQSITGVYEKIRFATKRVD